jgi:hypothetical protein
MLYIAAMEMCQPIKCVDGPDYICPRDADSITDENGVNAFVLGAALGLHGTVLLISNEYDGVTK